MARKSEQIASLFAAVGFKVDNASLKRLESSLAGVEKRLNNIVKGFKSVGTGSLTSALRATAKDSGKAAAGIAEVTAKLKSGIPAITVYTQQMRALAGALREVSGAAPRRLPTIPNPPRSGGGSSPANSPRGNGGIFGGMGGIGGFARGLLPGIGGAYALMNVVNTGRGIIGNENAMAAITGSEAKGRAEMEYVKKFSKEWSLDYGAQAESYKGILAAAQGSGMQGAGSRKVFEGASLYGAALQIDSEKMKRGMTALTQMLSKGKVMSEELKGQLAEALPGAVQAFAKSLGKSVPEMYKMMELGQVTSDELANFGDILKAQAQQGGALERFKKTSIAAQNDLRNAWTDFSTALMTSGLDKVLVGVFQLLAELLPKLRPYVLDIVSAFELLLKAVKGWVMIFDILPDSIGNAIIGLGLLYAAVNKFGWKKTGLGLFLYGLLLVLDDINEWTKGSEGKNSLFGQMFGAWEDFSDSLTPMFQAFDRWVESIVVAAKYVRQMAQDAGLISADPNKAPAGMVPNPNKKSFGDRYGEHTSKYKGQGILTSLVSHPAAFVRATGYWVLDGGGEGLPDYVPGDAMKQEMGRARLAAIQQAAMPSVFAKGVVPSIIIERNYVMTDNLSGIASEVADVSGRKR